MSNSALRWPLAMMMVAGATSAASAQDIAPANVELFKSAPMNVHSELGTKSPDAAATLPTLQALRPKNQNSLLAESGEIKSMTRELRSPTSTVPLAYRAASGESNSLSSNSVNWKTAGLASGTLAADAGGGLARTDSATSDTKPAR